MKINFELIREKQGVKGICGTCKKRKSRIVVVEETINPFNTNTNGTIKNRREVCQSVHNKLITLVKKLSEDFVCSSCKKYITHCY